MYLKDISKNDIHKYKLALQREKNSTTYNNKCNPIFSPLKSENEKSI